MSKHTPGPWIVSPWHNVSEDCEFLVDFLPIGPSLEGPFVANVLLLNSDYAEANANARLIAAAPDLLDICERLLGFTHHYAHESALLAGEGMLAKAKAIIAQAKGKK